MPEAFPRHGPLSGMILTGLAAAGMLGAGLLPATHAALGAPSPALVNAFSVSVALMVAHKAESYALREHAACPVYRTIAHDAARRPIGEVLFLTLIPALLGAFVLIALILRGGAWPMLALGIWLGQGLHEWHHLGKTLARRAYYPGVVTGVLFALHVAWGFAPYWFAVADAGPRAATIYGGAGLLALVAFTLEDARWFPRWTTWRAAHPGEPGA